MKHDHKARLDLPSSSTLLALTPMRGAKDLLWILISTAALAALLVLNSRYNIFSEIHNPANGTTLVLLLWLTAATSWFALRRWSETQTASAALTSSSSDVSPSRGSALEQLIDSIPDPIFQLNENGEFQTCNKAYEDFFSMSQSVIVGKTHVQVTNDATAREADRINLELIQNGTTRIYEAEVIDGGGELRTVVFHKSGLTSENGVPCGLIATIVDITKRRQMETSLKENEERQQHFAADVAHELRTPLAILRTHLDNLGASDIARNLRNDVDNMSRMVTQLLAESRIENYVASDSYMAIDLGDICRNAATLLAPVAIKENREIEVTGADLPIVIEGVQESLEQAVRNLVENAIRYSSRGSVITLNVGVNQESNAPYIRVIDRGRGIPLNQREKIFERLQRADRRGGGAGLGLSIVKRSVENHNAEISIEDTPEGGATFIINFANSPVIVS